MMIGGVILHVVLLGVGGAATNAAPPVPIPLDYVLIESDVVLNVDARLSRDIGAVDSVADCAAFCSRDAHCESLLFAPGRCVLYAGRVCQLGTTVPSTKGGVLLEKVANVAIDGDRVVIHSSSCAQYDNGGKLSTYDSQVKATFDPAMDAAVSDFTSTCHMHCQKTTFCQSYSVEMTWDAVPAQVNLHCATYSNSIYSGDGSAIRYSACERRQLTYGIHGRALSHANCGRPLPNPPRTSAPGALPGYALVAEHEYIDAESAGDVFGALSAASCASICDRDAACQAFVYGANLQRCQLFNVRHCMVAYSSAPGDWTFWGDVYERVGPVTVFADHVVFDVDCGEYSGVQIGSANIGNFTDKERTCRQLCSTTTSPYPCLSWEVMAYAPNKATCRLFADSLFQSSPPGGFYSTRRGLCPTAPWPHSTYSLAAQATSVMNCGRTPRPSLAKSQGGGSGSGSGDGGMPLKAPGTALPPPGQAVEAIATPSADSAAGSATTSALVAMATFALGLLLL